MSDGVVCARFRICVSGSAGSGKSCLVDRLTHGIFSENTCSTVGIKHSTKTAETPHKIAVNLNYCDLAGQERFRTACSPSYRNADVVLIVIDISSDVPGEDVQYWIKEASDYVEGHTSILLVANKIDKTKSEEDRFRGIEAHGVDYRILDRVYAGMIYYVSSKTGEGISSLEGEIMQIMQMTERYQELVAQVAMDAPSDYQHHVRGPITGEAYTPRLGSRDDAAPLLSVVSNSNGVLRLVETPHFIQLVGGDSSRGTGGLIALGSSESPRPSEGSHLGSGSGGCAC